MSPEDYVGGGLALLMSLVVADFVSREEAQPGGGGRAGLERGLSRHYSNGLACLYNGYPLYGMYICTVLRLMQCDVGT